MPEIETSPIPRAVRDSSGSSAHAPGASLTRWLPARLRAELDRISTAVRARFAEIITYEESPVPFIQCEHCGDIHAKTTRCASRAVGFCVNEGRRRLLNGGACSKCGSRSVTDVHFRWSVKRGAK